MKRLLDRAFYVVCVGNDILSHEFHCGKKTHIVPTIYPTKKLATEDANLEKDAIVIEIVFNFKIEDIKKRKKK